MSRRDIGTVKNELFEKLLVDKYPIMIICRKPFSTQPIIIIDSLIKFELSCFICDLGKWDFEKKPGY